MNFVGGFAKTAAKASGWAGTAKKVWEGAKDVAHGFRGGIESAGNVALKKHLNPMKAVGHLQDAAKAGLKTQAGRKAVGTAIGKAAPSIAATGAAAYGAKKIYDKTLGSSGNGSYSQGGYY